jgi:hypothetical protein
MNCIAIHCAGTRQYRSAGAAAGVTDAPEQQLRHAAKEQHGLPPSGASGWLAPFEWEQSGAAANTPDPATGPPMASKTACRTTA